MPLYPGKEPLNDPTSFVAAQSRTVLRRLANAIGSVWRDQFRPFIVQFRIQVVAIVRAISNRIFRSRLDHVEIEPSLDQRDVVAIGDMRGNCEWLVSHDDRRSS